MEDGRRSRKRRKKYLSRNELFVVPEATQRYRRNNFGCGSSTPNVTASLSSSGDRQAPDGSESEGDQSDRSDSRAGARTPPRNPPADDIVPQYESADDDNVFERPNEDRQLGKVDQCSQELDEDSAEDEFCLSDDELDHCSDVSGSSQSMLEVEDDAVSRPTGGEATSQSNAGDEACTATEHDSAGSRDNTEEPAVLDEAELLAECFREFGDDTLPNSPTKKVEAVALVMTFVISQNLSWTAVDDLLTMINTLFGCGDVLPRSKYLFRRLWAQRVKTIVQHHYYCEVCGTLLDKTSTESQNLLCTNCDKRSSLDQQQKLGCFFSIMNMEEQIKFLLLKNKETLYNSLKKKQEQHADNIEDITSALLYRELQHKGIIKWSDITLTINTDGSPVFTSSRASVWPLQFTVNELPPPERFSSAMLGGLWFGQRHPQMEMFMDMFVEEVAKMKPIQWTYKTEMLCSRVLVLCCCVDAPARAAVQNHTLYSGYFSCPRCLIPGVRVGGAIRFPTSKTPVRTRTHEDTRRDMEWALQYQMPVNGVKGPSPLLNLAHFDMVRGQTVDYMHCLLLGVTRQLTEAILSHSEMGSTKGYYIGEPVKLEKLEERMRSIHPPHCFTRLPRRLRDRADWKASEWRHWLLFYMLPCIFGYLPQSHWRHLAKLVEASAILLSTNLTLPLINSAATLLHGFVVQVESLYCDVTQMTFNVHQLSHLAEAARDLGPLWAHSAFVFEAGNGRVLKHVKGGKGVPLQIIERIVMEQQLETLLLLLPLSEKTTTICKNMLGYKRLKSFFYSDGACMLGSGKTVRNFSFEEQVALATVCGTCPDTAFEFFRFTLNSIIHHSLAYKRPEKSDSTVCVTNGGDYVRIHRILRVPVNGDQKCVLLCKELVIEDAHVALPRHIHRCFESPELELHPLYVKDIANVCLFFSFACEETCYVCDLPNFIERD